MAGSIFQKRSICLITGASRGLGKTIAVELSKKFENGLFILMSRNSKLQKATVNEINPKNTVKSHIIDFSTAVKDDIELELNESLKGVNMSEYEQVLINNYN